MTVADVGEIEKMINQGLLQQAEIEINQKLMNDSNDAEQSIYLLSLQGDIWFYRQRFIKAQMQYTAALKLAEIEQDFVLQAEQMKNVAITHSEMANYGKALKWHNLAKQALLKSDVDDDQVKLIELSMLLSKGMIFSHVGATELATETLAQAQNLAYKTNNMKGLNNAYLRLAALHFEYNRFGLGLDALDSINLNSFKDMSDYAWFYGLKFNLLLAIQNWTGAESLVKEILNHQFQWTVVFLDQIIVLQAQLSLAQNKLNQAEIYINELGTSESHKDSWLVNYLRASKHGLENNNIEALKHYERAIKQYLGQLEQLNNQQAVLNVPTRLFADSIKMALLTAYQDNEKMFSWLQWAAQHRYLLNPLDAVFIENKDSPTVGQNEVVSDVINNQFLQPYNHFGLSELQTVLETKEGVLIYLQLDHDLMVFLIEKDKFQALKLSAESPDVQYKVASFINQINQQGRAWEESSLELERVLLQPLRDFGLDSLTHLHIIPDENLRFMPFELLLDEQGNMVIDRFQLVMNSFSGLSQLIKHRSSQQQQLSKETRLSFVGTNNNLSDVASYWRTAYRNLEFSTKDYKGIQKEHELIKSLNMQGQVFFKQNATESHVVDMINNETGILHISSHGFDNSVAPAFSALVLNPDGSSDGLLQAREVVQNQSQLSLLVLASCSSAKGGLSGRYGNQLGLADAFIQSGVRGVIGTLWDVKDQSTAEFMQWFYQSLSHVQVPAIALRETKLKARNAGWPAKDWSAFVMLGDNSTAVTMKPLNDHNFSGLTYLMTIIISTFLLLMLFYISYNSSRRH